MATELKKASNVDLKDVNLEEIQEKAKNLPVVKIISTQQTNEQCGLITFEGMDLGQFDPIPAMDLGFTTVTFDSSWASILEDESNFANEPTPITVADLAFNSFGDILASNPVASVSFYYASLPDITVELYDSNNILLSSTTYPGNYQFFSDHPYSKWDLVTLSFNSNIISRIRITTPGYAGYTIIDNIQLCELLLTRGILFSV